MAQTLIVVTESDAVLVFLPKKHTGPMPKKALTTEVVLRAQPPQSIDSIAVDPATVIAHPNLTTSVIVLVQASVLAVLEDSAHEVTVVVASTVGVGAGVAHPYSMSI